MILKSISFACIIIITISFSAFPDAVGILERRKLSDAYHMKNIFQLIRFSKSKNHIVKHQAVQYLGVLKNITSINALIDCMDDEFLTMTAADALSKMGKSAVIPLIDALSSKSENMRCGAALALAYLGPLAGPAVPALIDILPKGWFSAHIGFVPNIVINEALPKIPGNSPIPQTFSASYFNIITARATFTMVSLAMAEYIVQSVRQNKLVRELKDGLKEILPDKIDTLKTSFYGYLQYKDIYYLENYEPYILPIMVCNVHAAAFALKNITHMDFGTNQSEWQQWVKSSQYQGLYTIEKVFHASTSSGAKNRESTNDLQETTRDNWIDKCIALMNEIGTGSSKLLISSLADEDPIVRAYALWGLGSQQNPQNLSYLVSSLDDPHWYVRMFAAEACGQYNDPSLNDRLKHIIENDTNNYVKISAERAWSKIPGPEKTKAITISSMRIPFAGHIPLFLYGKRDTLFNYPKMDSILYAINDQETMKLFHTGKRIGKQGQIVGLVGVSIMAASAAGIIAGVLMEEKKYRKDVFIASGSGLGASLIIVIASFNRMHKADQYIIKAVERYNNVIKDRWGISVKYNNKNSQFGLTLNYNLSY